MNSTPHTMPFLEFRNIHASIGGKPILKDISFAIEQGELLTLVGPSGCGKTTTLRVLAGFLSPDSGDVLVNARSILHLPAYKRNIGIVFQDYALFPHMNVAGNIAFGLKMHNWSKNRITNRIEKLLKLMHLEGYEDRRTNELSGGEKQRVAVARALAPEPEVLLLDEPLSALDARLREELRREIKRIQRELSLTVIYVTHDQEEALSLSTVLGVMNTGKIEQLGTPLDVYRNPATKFTAKFMGSSNLIDGTVEQIKRSDDRGVVISTREGSMFAQTTDPLEKGEKVSVFFRSEDAVLLPASAVKDRYTSETKDGKEASKANLGKKAGNMITGTLEDLDFFGDEIRARVRGKGKIVYTLKVSSWEKEFDIWVHIGKEVRIRVEKCGIIRV